jgi:hypothetical protein
MRQHATDWAVSEFGGAPGLEKRLRGRLVRTAAALAARPSGSLPQRFDWAELKGAYRLVHAAAAHPEAVPHVHRVRTRQRLRAVSGPVLIIHDSTVLSYSHHPAVRDQLGPITDDLGRGFIQHNSLVVDPGRGAVLGLIHQQTFCRQPHPAGETRAQRYHRPDRESRIWTEGVRAAGRPPAGACWAHVDDRAADFFGLMATARAHGGHFLIRLVQKTGCGIKDLRFETRDRLLAAIALLSVVAVRVLGLRWARDAQPDDPAEAIAGAEELAVLAALAPHKPCVRTVRMFVDRVAGLGGFLGRTCDGRPGWQRLWRGYQRLADLVLGASLAITRKSSKPPPCG